MSNIYFKLKDNDGNIKDLELIEHEISDSDCKITFKNEKRFEIRYMNTAAQSTPLSMFQPIDITKKPVIYDNKKDLPLPVEVINVQLAKQLCEELNELATIKENNKPKPLKTEILQILNKIDEPQYEMANKIKKQKQHIKDLENKIRLLKRDNHSLQRNYCKKTTDLNQIKEERDYYQQKLTSWRENGYELPWNKNSTNRL